MKKVYIRSYLLGRDHKASPEKMVFYAMKFSRFQSLNLLE